MCVKGCSSSIACLSVSTLCVDSPPLSVLSFHWWLSFWGNSSIILFSSFVTEDKGALDVDLLYPPLFIHEMVLCNAGVGILHNELYEAVLYKETEAMWNTDMGNRPPPGGSLYKDWVNVLKDAFNDRSENLMKNVKEKSDICAWWAIQRSVIWTLHYSPFKCSLIRGASCPRWTLTPAGQLQAYWRWRFHHRSKGNVTLL